MKKFLVGCLAVTGFLTFVVTGLIGVGVWYALEKSDMAWEQHQEGISLPNQFMLSLDLRALPADSPEDDLEVAFGLESNFDMLHLVEALRRAADDERVAGIVARIGDDPGSIAQVQEVRDAIALFRESGKPSFAWSDTFGEWNAANSGYWLASAFEHISMQPGGLVALTGMHLQVPLFAGPLEKIGVRFDGDSRGKYKTMRDTFAEQQVTPEHQEMLDSLAESLSGQMISDIAAGRQLTEATVRELMDRAPLTAGQALAAGLVDDDQRYETTLDELLPETGSGDDTWNRVGIRKYSQHLTANSGVRVAIIQATGNILRGEKPSGQFGETGIYGDSLARLLDDLANDEHAPFDAVLLRIDSGGGSAIASATMGHSLRNLVEKMPVVISMGSAAASGGYWLAMHGTEIVAQPGTFTGSIGVVVGKPDISLLSERVGLIFAESSIGENADLWTFSEPYDSEGRARLTDVIDSIYGDFLAGAAEGRGLTVEDVRKVAEGRVWTGAQAMDIGLVDQLGGYHTALSAIRRHLALEDDAPLSLERVPGPPDPFDIVRDVFGMVQSVGLTASRLQAMLTDPATAHPLLGMTPVTVR